MASNFLSKPITDIINTAIYTNTFPDRAKRASVTPIDKGGNDNHIYTNYRPVSILKTFSKVIELAIFDQLTKHANLAFITFSIKSSQSVRHTRRTYKIA